MRDTLVSPSELKRLMERAMSDSRDISAFFRALLDAIVYAHVPISDDTGRLRFVQFARPDNGEVVLPFFIDESEAYATTGNSRRVVALQGRVLLQHTLGATLMLDPNGVRCVLYPEEIRELLSTGRVAELHAETIEKDREMLLGPADSVPDWLEPILSRLFPDLPFVETAYLLVTARPEDPAKLTLLILLGVAAAYAERSWRAIATALQTQSAELKLPIDMISYDPSDGPPELLKGIDVAPIYIRQP
ncbi:MAG: SseB family protein [Acidobacteria bacterium]|nr:SseB family protein [Acidobacteriota bacterium]